MWAAGVDFMSFFRHVACLPLDYSKWQHYEEAAIRGSFRWMHGDFCIVSDFPEVLKVDQDNRPHCEDGPSHRWRDGFEIYHWHGYRLPIGKEWVIANKANITPDLIDSEENAELRRVMLEIHGFERYVATRDATVVAEDMNHGQPRRLLSMRVRGDDMRVLDVWNGSLEPDGSRRRFFLGAIAGAATPHDAVAMSYGRAPANYGEAART